MPRESLDDLARLLNAKVVEETQQEEQWHADAAAKATRDAAALQWARDDWQRVSNMIDVRVSTLNDKLTGLKLESAPDPDQKSGDNQLTNVRISFAPSSKAVNIVYSGVFRPEVTGETNFLVFEAKRETDKMQWKKTSDIIDSQIDSALALLLKRAGRLGI